MKCGLTLRSFWATRSSFTPERSQTARLRDNLSPVESQKKKKLLLVPDRLDVHRRIEILIAHPSSVWIHEIATANVAPNFVHHFLVVIQIATDNGIDDPATKREKKKNK